MNRTTFKYKADDEWHGELSARLHCGEFTGYGSAWFNVSQILAFAKAIEAYPVAVENPATLEGGMWENGSIVQANLRIRIIPFGRKGHLTVSVELAPSNQPEGILNEVRVSYPVTYGDLGNFRSALIDHMHGRSAEATLEQSAS